MLLIFWDYWFSGNTIKFDIWKNFFLKNNAKLDLQKWTGFCGRGGMGWEGKEGRKVVKCYVHELCPQRRPRRVYQWGQGEALVAPFYMFPEG